MAQDEFLGEMMCSALTRERTKLTTLLLFGVIRRELSEYHVREGLGEEENEGRGNGEGWEKERMREDAMERGWEKKRMR